MLKLLNKFIPYGQISNINSIFTDGTVESVMLFERLKTLEERIAAMPETHATEGEGDKALVHLRYSIGDKNFYIIEKDSLEDQHQAFAYIDFGDGMAELGYQSIIEIQQISTAELDLEWVPTPLKEIKISLQAHQ